MANVQVEVFAELGVVCVGIDIENPAIKELVQAVSDRR